MKKLILTLCTLLGTAAGAVALDLRAWPDVREGTNNHLDLCLTQAVVAPAEVAQPVSWMKAVAHQTRKAVPTQGALPHQILANVVPAQHEPSMTSKQRKTIDAVKAKWQLAVYQQTMPLKGFRVVTVRPNDILALSYAEKEYIGRVLSGACGEKLKAEEFKHYMVRVTLPGTKPIHLLFNCFSREIYVVRGDAQLPGVPLEELPTRRF